LDRTIKLKGPIVRQSRHLFIVALVIVAGFGCEPEPKAAAPELPPAAPVRHIDLEGQLNFRDLGGNETAEGRMVKWGEVYRSGELPRLTDADVAFDRPVADDGPWTP
jgi:hypothetical protein